MRGSLKLNWGDEYQGARIEKGYVTILVEAKIRRMCVRIYKPNHVNVSSIRIIECPIRGGRRRYETIVESWRKNLQSFREMAGLIGRSIDLHYGSLLFSLSSSSSSTAPPCSSAVKGRGCWLWSKEGERKRRRGRKKDSMESMNRSPFSFFHRLLHFSSLFRNTERRPWEPMLPRIPHDRIAIPSSLSLFIRLLLLFLSLSLSLPFSRHFVGKSTLDSRIDAPLERSSSTIRFFLAYVHRVLTFPRSPFLLENKNLVFFLSPFRKENIAKPGELRRANFYFFRELTDTCSSSYPMFQFLDFRISERAVFDNRG